MPGTVADGPTVAMSFANNFWGKDDAGVGPMLERMHTAKVSCDELKTFYNIRAAIEEEYARKLLALCRKPLGSTELGSLRSSFDVVRGETEAIAKAHGAIAGQMKRELEEPLVAFAGGSKERRKIIQTGIERLLKTKMQQTQTVNKTRDRYEQDCLRIKGYLAQGHMVMGQEERKNKAKLEKTQIQLASSSSEYEAAIKVLEETTGRWNKEWKSACDKFQDLEEERLDFTKSSLWAYANIASTVCVSDDASCEKIRLSLENCEVEKDIVYFIKERGTGQDIPDPPRFINFCRGDINDTSSEVSEEDGFSVAQFQRTINPAFRSSSPQPSTYESHHDPQSDLANQMAHNNPPTPTSRETTVTPQKPTQQPAPLDLRRGGQLPPNYDPSEHGEIGSVPHNAYPTDAPSSNYSSASVATPPPAYNDSSVKRLDAPQPAFTSAQMQKTTQKYTGQTHNMLRGSGNTSGLATRNRAQSDAPRARSPTPRRSASPQVNSPRVDTRMSQYSRGPSRGPSPSPSTYQSSSMRSRFSQSPTVSTPPQRPADVAYSPHEYPRRTSPNPMSRGVSPQPQFRQQARPSSAGGMELQLANQVDMYGGDHGSPRQAGKPGSFYDAGSHRSRSRSRTLAVADPGRQFSRDGRPILHFARAMYSYTAAIPEELGFTKGDVLSVIRLQDDGWWEAEVTTTRGRTGLVPSNYLQII
ncbi:unnamed protein product [Aspergillus oryzae RIB40]|uniref:DNA, SC003 n=1 Tax=Aspergillus oryzae (strain ATCC 42149 / RIB 40) TaxID=510516 RepID=Q2UL35_ASPOR|nr:unnamed protein product [Aspergillus oryzae RIB40]BAE57730.1 unnamed protein product [Aspergillus oryzae RIB40]